MNRLRRAYLQIAPGVEPYFTTGHHDDNAGSWTRCAARRRGSPRRQTNPEQLAGSAASFQPTEPECSRPPWGVPLGCGADALDAGALDGVQAGAVVELIVQVDGGVDQRQVGERVGARNSVVGPELRVRPCALLARMIGAWPYD
jgi:hypothetical protein